jgi:CheY-like chemotaxis protein
MPDLTNTRTVSCREGPHATSRIRLLIIDDSESDQELLLIQLSRIKFNDDVLLVSDAGRAKEVLLDEELALGSKLSIVFLDLNLGPQSGLEILRLIKSHPALKHLPVIVLTGSEDPADKAECERLKATQFLSKPIISETLSSAMADAIRAPDLA